METPVDQTPQLIHAILHRKGVVCFRSTPNVDGEAPSLRDRIKAIADSIDTAEKV
jgi:hypothetical protein